MQIFDNEDFGSLFSELADETELDTKPSSQSLLGEDDDDDVITKKSTKSSKEKSDDDSDDSDIGNPSLFADIVDDDEDAEEQGDAAPKKKPGRKPKEEVTAYGEAVQALIKEVEDFSIWEDTPEDKTDYTSKEFVELVKANIDDKVEKYVNGTLENIVNSFSPSIQNIIKAELRGVKVKDLIADIKDYEEIENIPDNPDNTIKEQFVKKFYKELAKEKGKSEDWANKQVERIIDGDDLDEEYGDAVKHFEVKIQEKIDAKAKAKEEEQKQKMAFKQHHAYLVHEVLKEDELFNVPLKKQDKQIIANVLAGFYTRSTDNKEKMGLTVEIDKLIHSQDKKKAYKTLALMSLVAVNPDGVIKALSDKEGTEYAEKTVKQLKVADKNLVSIRDKQKQVRKSSASGDVFF
jgi:hypothetical protein